VNVTGMLVFYRNTYLHSALCSRHGGLSAVMKLVKLFAESVNNMMLVLRQLFTS
jgi:hypothetical protein